MTNWGELKETRWIIAVMIEHDSTTPARSTTCAPCTSKTISAGIIRGEPGSFIFLDRSLKGEQFGKLAVFHLGKPGVEVLRSRVCAATGQIAAPCHRPDRLPGTSCLVNASPPRYPDKRGCLKRTPPVFQAYNWERKRTPSSALYRSPATRTHPWLA